MKRALSSLSHARRACSSTGNPATVSVIKKGMTMEDVKKDWEAIDHMSLEMRPPAASEKFEGDVEVARKRLLFQSTKRGMLEMDCLLGGYGRKYIPTMDADALKQWNDILREYDNDLYMWLVKRENLDTVSETIKDAPVFTDLLNYAQNKAEHKYQDEE